jgi:hypothetical protein
MMPIGQVLQLLRSATTILGIMPVINVSCEEHLGLAAGQQFLGASVLALALEDSRES